MAPKKLVKLRDTTGIFRDPVTGFTLVRDQTLPLPDQRGAKTRQWLNAGGLILFDSPEQPSPTPPPDAPIESVVHPEGCPATDLSVYLSARADELEAAHTKVELLELLEQLGIDPPPRALKRELATIIASSEWGG